jgi:hypothetical protein
VARDDGRTFDIHAAFVDCVAGTRMANQLMDAEPWLAVLATTGGRILLAHKDDKGTAP